MYLFSFRIIMIDIRSDKHQFFNEIFFLQKKFGGGLGIFFQILSFFGIFLKNGNFSAIFSPVIQ